MDISKDNRGTSLIELIIGVLIAAIVLSMILLFLNSASKGFRRTNDDVNLQMEAQTIINQISNLAMEATDMEPYLDIPDEKRFIFMYKLDEYYTIIHHGGFLYQVSTTDIEQAKVEGYSKELHLLAEYVESLDIEHTSDSKTIDIILRLSLGKDSVELKKKVKLRNAR